MTDPINTMIQILAAIIPLMIGIILFSSTIISKWRWLVAILLLIGISGPFFYTLMNPQFHPAIGVNINLVLSLFFVWTCSVTLVLIACIRIYLAIKSKKR